MNQLFHDNKPIFLQIKEKIEDQIVNEQLKAHDQIPSTTQMVHFYNINHITISKGINLLVDEGLLYKKRGVGMFVAEEAREKLLQNRRQAFAENYVLPMLREAVKLSLTTHDIEHIIKKIKEEHSYEL